MKFPQLIHVTEEGEDENKYFNVLTDGIVSIDEPGKAIAIYKLVEVGRVDIHKSFVKRGAKP